MMKTVLTDTEELKKRISESGYKMVFIAKKCGLSYQGFLNKVNGIQEFLPSEINAICDLLNINDVNDRMSIFFLKM